jgi:hypothetical protein
MERTREQPIQKDNLRSERYVFGGDRLALVLRDDPALALVTTQWSWAEL